MMFDGMGNETPVLLYHQWASDVFLMLQERSKALKCNYCLGIQHITQCFYKKNKLDLIHLS